MFNKVNEVLNQKIRPALQSHGGDVDLVKIEENKVYVKLQGGCRGCPGARMTIKNGVERILKTEFPEIAEVIDVTDHA